MLARGDIPSVDPLHASLLQGLQLLEAVDVARDQLAVDLDLHRVEPELLAVGERDEDGDLRVGRIEELLLEAIELGRDAEDVRLDLLDLLVQALHLLLGALPGEARGAAEAGEQRGDESPGQAAAVRQGAAARVRAVRTDQDATVLRVCLQEGLPAGVGLPATPLGGIRSVSPRTADVTTRTEAETQVPRAAAAANTRARSRGSAGRLPYPSERRLAEGGGALGQRSGSCLAASPARRARRTRA